MWSIRLFNFDFYFIFYNFILYSFFGWVYESCFVSIQHKTLTNRGFLNGPIIPLYGSGATIVYLLLAPVQENSVYVFVGGMCIATILEYVTSYVMEKLFHAKWWDYSDMKFNFHGRICLVASLFWGFLSILMTEVLQPPINFLISRFPRKQAEIAGYFIIIIFIADLTSTVIATVQIDRKLSRLQKIREDLSAYLENRQRDDTKISLSDRLEKTEFFEWSEQFKTALEERIASFEQLREANALKKKSYHEETKQRILRFKAEYGFELKHRNFIQKRLLKAFPTLTSTNREGALKDFRSRILKKNNDAKKIDDIETMEHDSSDTDC